MLCVTLAGSVPSQWPPAHSGWGLRVEILAALLLNLSFQAPQLGTGSSYVFLGPL